ncbi:MAG: hypothetical protein HC923_01005, partial [Myxococcales bacterium]|nr:hypothetical protein [Myxococcales bacterium]
MLRPNATAFILLITGFGAGCHDTRLRDQPGAPVDEVDVPFVAPFECREGVAPPALPPRRLTSVELKASLSALVVGFALNPEAALAVLEPALALLPVRRAERRPEVLPGGA